MITLPARPPAERFDRIMQGVAAALAAQHKEGRLFGTLLLLTWTRLRQAGVRVLALAAAYAAGTLRLRPSRERPYRPRPKAPPEAASAATPQALAAKEPKLPSGFGWLLGRARVGFGRSQMAYLLAQPDMQDLIAAVPPIAHHLRPVCRMLGVKPPPGLFPPRRSPRRPPRAAQAPDPPAPPPDAAAADPELPDPAPPAPPGTPFFVRPPQRFRRRRRRPVALFPFKPA